MESGRINTAEFPLPRPPGVNDLLRLRNNMMAGHFSLMTGCAFASKSEPKTAYICIPNCPATAVKLLDSIAPSRIKRINPPFPLVS